MPVEMLCTPKETIRGVQSCQAISPSTQSIMNVARDIQNDYNDDEMINEKVL